MEHIILALDVYSHDDDRGSVIFPVQDLEISPGEMLNIHCGTIEPGSIRGNHFHADHDEFIVLFGNGMELVAKTGPGSQRTIRIGQIPQTFKIYKGVAHAIINKGVSTGFITCWHMGEAGEIKTERVYVIE